MLMTMMKKYTNSAKRNVQKNSFKIVKFGLNVCQEGKLGRYII